MMNDRCCERRENPKSPLADNHGQRGFTLPELLVVLVILGLIIGIAAPSVIKYVGSSRTKAAALQVERLSGILDLYRLDVGKYPTSDDGLNVLIEAPQSAKGWNGPYMKKADALKDPWGRPYQYRSPGEHGEFDLFSLGADNQQGGDGEDQDITSW